MLSGPLVLIVAGGPSLSSVSRARMYPAYSFDCVPHIVNRSIPRAAFWLWSSYWSNLIRLALSNWTFFLVGWCVRHATLMSHLQLMSGRGSRST